MVFKYLFRVKKKYQSTLCDNGVVILVCLLHACFFQLSDKQIGFPRGVVCFLIHIEAGDGFINSPFLDLLLI